MKGLVIVVLLGLLIGLVVGVAGQFQVADVAGHEGQLVASTNAANYVLIQVPNWPKIFINPAVLILGLIALFTAVYFLVRFVILVLTAPRKTRKIVKESRARKARSGLQRGLLQLAEGNWSKAEKTLERSAKHSDIPMLHHLGAARAAQLQQKSDQRDQYLQAADNSLPKPTHAVLITQAELQMGYGQYEQALATIEHVREKYPKHPYALRLLAQLHQHLGAWDQLFELMPKMKKYGAFNETELTDLERNVAAQRLQLAGQQYSMALTLESGAEGNAANGGHQASNEIKQRWRELSRKQRQDLELRRIYVRELIAVGDERFAAAAIVDGLKQQWDEGLLLAYSKLRLDESAQQLKQVERWLKQHEDDPVVLLVAGRVCLHKELLGKARSYLEASVTISPLRETYEELAGLYLQLGENDKAQEAYRLALAQDEQAEIQARLHSPLAALASQSPSSQRPGSQPLTSQQGPAGTMGNTNDKAAQPIQAPTLPMLNSGAGSV